MIKKKEYQERGSPNSIPNCNAKASKITKIWNLKSNKNYAKEKIWNEFFEIEIQKLELRKNNREGIQNNLKNNS